MNNHKTLKQNGFTLIEVMVGLVIGLIVTLVVADVFRVFEGQKRTTTGNSDAQTNGAIALFNLQRDAQMAGYGLPVYSSDVSPFKCPISTEIDHDNNATSGSPSIGLSPVVITDGNGPNGSDTLSIRFGTSMKGGIPVEMIAGTSTNTAQVENNLGCAPKDVALVINSSGTNYICSMTRVGPLATDVNKVGLISTIKLDSSTNVAVGNTLACLGAWNQVTYSVANNQLTRSGDITAGVPSNTAVPMVPDIVNMQAQYGISNKADSNQVTQWVNATGAFANTATTPTLADRNRIKSVRVAIVARNGLLENTNVTDACSGTNVAKPTGLCAWDGAAAGSDAPAIDLTADTNWRRYRYRVYETIIPVRNIIWSRSDL